MIDPPKIMPPKMSEDIAGKIQRAIVNSSYYNYDKFKNHMNELLEDCNFISCSFGEHGDSLSRKSSYELNSISNLYDRYKWEPRWENAERYDYEYYTATGYPDWTAVKDIPLNTCRLMNREGYYMDVQFIHESMYRVGELYFDNLDNLDAHILKWVLS